MSIADTMKEKLLQKLGVKPQTIQHIKKASELSKKYPMTKQGAIQAVNDYGGHETLRKGVEFARNTPIIAKAVAMLGLDVKQLENLADDILNDKHSSEYNSFKTKPKGTNNALKNRLRKHL